jgi:uncharacterized membrane protein
VEMKPPEEQSIAIEQHIEAPASNVAAYIGDFRNAKEWMVGIEGVERLSKDTYRLMLESPVGRLEPEVRILEHGEGLIHWLYTSAIEGDGKITVAPAENGRSCVVSYTGAFRLKSRVLNRAARFVGIERFARRNGERSLQRLKHLMEVRHY